MSTEYGESLLCQVDLNYETQPSQKVDHCGRYNGVHKRSRRLRRLSPAIIISINCDNLDQPSENHFSSRNGFMGYFLLPFP